MQKQELFDQIVEARKDLKDKEAAYNMFEPAQLLMSMRKALMDAGFEKDEAQDIIIAIIYANGNGA